jgi:1-hydroxycarotenoid 3,4-desaturase
MSAPRTIIIGAGIGGLTSAALLAAAGCDVTVVEAASHAGGKVRQDMVDGVAIDAGPTVFTKRPIFDAIFDACGASLDDYIHLTPANILARHAWGDDRLDLFADVGASEDAIGAFAGSDAAKGFARFCIEAKRVHDCIDKPFMRSARVGPLGLAARIATQRPRDLFVMRPFESLWKVLGDFFPDPRLRQLFGRYATYTGASPFLAPSTLMLIAHVEAEGVWLVDGGLSSLARALEALARKNGARFRFQSKVDRILTDFGHVAGVQLTSGERIVGDTVVLNGDSAALAAGMFGVKAVTPYPPERRSLSAITFLGAVKAEGFPLTHHNVFFSNDYRAEFDAIGRGHLAAEPTAYLCAQDRLDSEILPKAKTWGRGTMRSMVEGPAVFAPPPLRGPPPLPLRAGEDLRADFERAQIIINAPANGDTHLYTDQEIETCRTAMLDTLAASGLTLSGGLQATTPTDFATRFPATGGALYGRASHGWVASFRRPGARTTIPGLYLAGGSTHPGAGVPMVALSGQLAAASIMKDRALTPSSRPVAMAGGMSTPSVKTAATG